jgi:hypothetical protein
VTSYAAIAAAETTTAPGGNPTPSVEHNESACQQIGSSMPILTDSRDTGQASISRPTSATASQRGQEWIARFGCPAWCVLDHAGTDGDPGWHQGPTAKVETPAEYADVRPGDGRYTALAARVTHLNELPDVFGTETKLWIDIDVETLELDAEQADVFIARLEQFLPVLRAMRDQVAEIAEDDIPENLAAKAAWLAQPLVPVEERLDKLCAEHDVQILAADGPNAAHLTEGVLLGADGAGARTFLIPSGQSSGATFVQLRDAIAAGGRP